MMKYLIVLLVVVVVGWTMLRGSRRQPSPPKRSARPIAAPQEMVVCRHCGIHLPRSDAVAGAGGMYCTEAHRIAGPRGP